MDPPNPKVVLVGAAGVGKTSLITHFMDGTYTMHTISTTQPTFCQKVVQVQGKDVTLEIWDTAGQERYHALSPLFYRNANTGIVVFDLTDQESADRAKSWAEELIRERGSEIDILFAANKSDLADKRILTQELCNALSDKYKSPIFDVSARTGEGINDLFLSAAKMFLEKSNLQQNTTQKTKLKNGEKPDKKCC